MFLAPDPAPQLSVEGVDGLFGEDPPNTGSDSRLKEAVHKRTFLKPPCGFVWQAPSQLPTRACQARGSAARKSVVARCLHCPGVLADMLDMLAGLFGDDSANGRQLSCIWQRQSEGWSDGAGSKIIQALKLKESLAHVLVGSFAVDAAPCAVLRSPRRGFAGAAVPGMPPSAAELPPVGAAGLGEALAERRAVKCTRRDVVDPHIRCICR